MINKRFLIMALAGMLLIGTALSAQTAPGHGPAGPAPHQGFGPMMGHDLENLPLGTTLTHEVKKLTGQALFSDRLIPVFAANGAEYEMRLPPIAFSGTNLKQGDTLEIQGIFSTLKTPDGKTINWVKPTIVKVAGKEINLDAFRFREFERDRRDAPRGHGDGDMGPGMGPGTHGKRDGNPDVQH